MELSFHLSPKINQGGLFVGIGGGGVDLLQVTHSDYGGRTRDPHGGNKMVPGSAEQALLISYHHITCNTQIIRLRVLQSSEH